MNKFFLPLTPPKKCRGDTEWLKFKENTFCQRKKYLPPPWRRGEKIDQNSANF
jgi:hypothetical protein